MAKYILVTYHQPTNKFVEDLLAVFGQDLREVFSAWKTKMTAMILMSLVCKMIDEMTVAMQIAKSEGADSRLIRVEGLALESGAFQFKFIPLDGGEQPILEDKRNPILIVGVTDDDIKREAQTRKLEIFTPPKDKPSEN